MADNDNVQTKIQSGDEDLVWTEPVTKGRKLMHLLHDANAIQSEWTRYADLASWDWHYHPESVEEPLYLGLIEFNGLSIVAKTPQAQGGIGVNQQDTEAGLHIAHLQSDEGQSFRRSSWSYTLAGATYCNTYMPSYGTIIANNNYGPRHAAQALAEEFGEKFAGDITPLQHWSDVVCLEWDHQCRKQKRNAKALNKVIHHDIANTTTKALIGQMLARAGSGDTVAPDKWPGTVFAMDGADDAGKALLATPNGLVWRICFFSIGTYSGGRRSRLFLSDDLDPETRTIGAPCLLFEIADFEPKGSSGSFVVMVGPPKAMGEVSVA